MSQRKFLFYLCTAYISEDICKLIISIKKRSEKKRPLF